MRSVVSEELKELQQNGYLDTLFEQNYSFVSI